MLLKSLCFCLIFLQLTLGEEVKEVETIEVKNEVQQPIINLEALNKFINKGDRSKILAKLQNVSLSRYEEQQTAVINEWVDEVVISMNLYLLESGYDPVPIEGLETVFGWGIFKGWVIFDRGQLRGLTTFARRNDVVVSYKYPDLSTDVSLGFDRISFEYRYVIKYMYIGPSGRAEGKSVGNRFTASMSLDLITGYAKLNEFTVNTLGSVSLVLKGSPLTDWLYNTVIWAIMPLVKGSIGSFLEEFVIEFINEMIGIYNGVVCNILGPCFEQILN